MRKLIFSLIALLILLPFFGLADTVEFDVSKDPTASSSAYVAGEAFSVRVPTRTSAAMTVEYTRANLGAGAMPLLAGVVDGSYTVHLYCAEAAVATAAANHGLGADFTMNTTTVMATTAGVGGLGFDLTAVANTFLTVADNAYFDVGTGDFALGAWINHATSSDIDHIFNKKDGSGRDETGYEVYLSATGTIVFSISDDSGATTDTATTTVEFDNSKWHEIWAVRRGTVLSVYGDGVLVATGAVSNAALTLNNAVSLNVGAAKASTTVFAGSIDSIEMVKGDSPTAAEVETHYAQAKEALNPALIRSIDSAITITSATATTPEIFIVPAFPKFNGWARIKSSASQTADIECDIRD